MKKARVPIAGTANDTVLVEYGATRGATFGRDVYTQDGQILTVAQLVAMAAGAVAPPEDVSKTAWSLLLDIPANITALEEATGTGIFSVTGAGTGAMQELEVGASSAVSLSIVNPGGVAGPPMFIVDPTLNALAGLDITPGLVEQAGADTFTKRAMGVANATDVLTRADGDGRFDSLGSAAAAFLSSTIYTDDEIAALLSALALIYLSLTGGEMSGDISFSQASVIIRGNTTAGNDTQRIAITASETVSTSRAANILLHGNDHATNPGVAQINAGTGADVVLNPGAGGSCRPNSDNARNLGSDLFRWANGYIFNMRLSGQEFQTGIGTPAQITSNQNDYTPAALATSRILRLSTDASRNITGLGAGTDGQRLTLLNVGAFDIVLTHNDAASTAANRFRCPGAASFTIRRDGGVELVYEETSDRWRVVAP